MNERGMLVKRLLTSHEMIGWLAKLWLEILERKVKVPGMLPEVCERLRQPLGTFIIEDLVTWLLMTEIYSQILQIAHYKAVITK